MVLSWLFEHDWKSVDINPPEGVGATLRDPLAEVTGLASRNSSVALSLQHVSPRSEWQQTASTKPAVTLQGPDRQAGLPSSFSPGKCFQGSLYSQTLIWQFWHQLHQTCKAVFAPDSTAVSRYWMSPWAKPDDFSRANLKELSHSIRGQEKETPTPNVYLLMSPTVIHFSPIHFHTSSLYWGPFGGRWGQVPDSQISSCQKTNLPCCPGEPVSDRGTRGTTKYKDLVMMRQDSKYSVPLLGFIMHFDTN